MSLNATGNGRGSSWQDACTSLSKAISVSRSGDEIWVSSGRYAETIVMKPSVALYGGFLGNEETRSQRNWITNKTIIDAAGSGRPAVQGSDKAVLDGFTITGGENTGIYCYRTSPTLTNCTITGNAGRQGGGVFCGKSSSPALTNCTLSTNTADQGAGLYCQESSPVLVNCTIVGNIALREGGGVYCESGSPSLTNCILWNPKIEIAGEASDSVFVTYSCVQGGWPGEGNISGYPKFVDATGMDYRLKNGSPCIDSGLVSAAPNDDITGRGRPGNDGFVDIGACESPPEYESGEDFQQSRLVHVRSDATPGGDGSSWEQAFDSIGAALQVMWATGEVWVAAGIYNESVGMEAGIAVYGGFSGTEEGREERDWTANETIIASKVVGADDGILDGFTVRRGVSCYKSSPKLINCAIIENRAAEGGGGVYCYQSSPTLINCSIIGNSAYEFGGVYCYQSSPNLVNCLIIDNAAIEGGGAISCEESSPTLTNCILWNAGPEIKGSGLDAVVVAYSCIQSGWPGEGNINADPLFVDPVNGDYRLRNGSPCVDRGFVTAAPNRDAEGSSRPGSDGLADMGAYESPPEYKPSDTAASPRRVFVRSGAGLGGDGSSWEKALNTIGSANQRIWATGEMWVAAGTYRETVHMEQDIAVYGGFSGIEETREKRDWVANETVINATGLNTPAVVGADQSILDGFIVTGGSDGGVFCYRTSPALSNCMILENRAEILGGGVYCRQSSLRLTDCIIAGNTVGMLSRGGGIDCFEESSATLVNCTIKENAGGGYSNGGGIDCWDGSSLTLINCTITENTAGSGAGVSCSQSSLILADCIISRNTATEGGAGGVSCGNSSVSLIGCTITGNTGSGFSCSGDPPPILINCTITENTATSRIPGRLDDGGGVYCEDSSPTLVNCTITGNTASAGGGIACRRASPSLTNCALAGNMAEQGGGLYCYQSSPILSNCNIDGNAATSYAGGGVYCRDGSAPIFADCAINRNSAKIEGGGLSCTESSPMLTNCVIEGNTTDGYGGGVYCRESFVALTNCIVVKNTARYGGGGVSSSGGASLALTNCTIAENMASSGGGGVHCWQKSFFTLTNCILWNSGSEIQSEPGVSVIVTYCCVQGGCLGEGNISGYPKFADVANGDYRLQNGSPCIDIGLVTAAPNEDAQGRSRPGSDGLVDMGAYESPPDYEPSDEWEPLCLAYVRADAVPGEDGSSWEHALNSIGSALQVLWTTGEVWVAAGTYRERVGMEPNIALYGGFSGLEKTREERDWTANETIIDAAGLGTAAVIGASYAILDGFTITGGEDSGVYCHESSPTLTNCKITGNFMLGERALGGGVCCRDASPTITNCTITLNAAKGAFVYGGGVYSGGGSPTLTNCTITWNRAEGEAYYVLGGGVCCSGGTSILKNCTIAWNTAKTTDKISPEETFVEGGGVDCSGSTQLIDCVISKNIAREGGGVHCSSATLVNCLIVDNAAVKGGGVHCGGSTTLTNCTIAGNMAHEEGGGVHCSYDASPTLVNCSFSGNSAGNGNALACSPNERPRPSTVKITNSILWDGEDEIWNNDDSTITISYSDICGGWPGEGNIDTDPLFVHPWDGENADLHLMPSSPCVDAGNPDPSLNDGCLPPGLGTERCDMGAYGGPGNCGWMEIPEPVGVLEWMRY
ncbi:MAG: right-handed parallel beta-helix repeat-containing protein [bacterium]